MDQKLQERFAQTYPKASQKQSRTPLAEVMPHTNTIVYVPSKKAYKFSFSVYKFLILIFITALIASFIYSTLAYTFSDYILSSFELDFFNESGQPNYPIIVVHTFIFAICIFILWTCLSDK